MGVKNTMTLGIARGVYSIAGYMIYTLLLCYTPAMWCYIAAILRVVQLWGVVADIALDIALYIKKGAIPKLVKKLNKVG
jgi:uncharacterized membrane protein (GlpM family)